MHSSSVEADLKQRSEGEVLVGLATLVTEGRIPGKLSSKSTGFTEGPHCTFSGSTSKDNHQCDLNDNLCCSFENLRKQILNLWQKNIPVCVEVFLTCSCKDNVASFDSEAGGLLLEQWYITINRRRSMELPSCNLLQLVNAIRSQLYFSQITAWLTSQDEKSRFKITSENLQYRLSLPGETVEGSEFSSTAVKHDFPATDIGHGFSVNVSFLSASRVSSAPVVTCPSCEKHDNFSSEAVKQTKVASCSGGQMLDDRMHINCTLKGKHRCEELEEFGNCKKREYSKKPHSSLKFNRASSSKSDYCFPEPSTSYQCFKQNQNLEKVNFYSVNPFDIQSKQPLMMKDFNSDEQYFGQKMQKNPVIDKHECKVMKVEERRCCAQQPDGVAVQNCHKCDLIRAPNKGQLLLDAIERTAKKCTNKFCLSDSDRNCDGSRCLVDERDDECLDDDRFCHDREIVLCDKSDSDIFSINKNNNLRSENCDNPDIPKNIKENEIKNKNFESLTRKKSRAVQKLTFDDEIKENSMDSSDGLGQCNGKSGNKIKIDIPSALEQAKFKKNLDSAASMVFHSQTGLPLTSSPAPMRRGKCFDFDSTINSVSAIKSALYSSSFSTDEESESEGSNSVSPCSPEIYVVPKRNVPAIKYRRKGHAANLLGSFEESVLNGRLEPVSTVHGFKAELGASGSFVPKHLVCPVTVFFYTLGDTDKMSSPYLGHINLGRKGYSVPKMGTLQVTLFNPLGTVVKMFVIMYDLSDMPPNSQTFIRQRTLYMPTDFKDEEIASANKWLRFLIHLRFMSSKSGKVYLHSDIRMIIIKKSDMDTATAHGIDVGYELRSFTHTPSNPRFSPRK